MTPSQLSAQLYHFAAEISNSKSPRRDLVEKDLQSLINKISADVPNHPEIPDRDPDEVNSNDTKIWKLDDNCELRVNDVGTIWWIKNGKFHREDGPAAIHPNGAKDWYKNGKLHREDGPAVENYNGTKEWYLNGERHREDGPAIEEANGSKYWFLHGKGMGKGKQPENWDELVKSMSNNITPSQVSSQLKLIASKISNSKSPDKDLVVKDLQLLINKISSDEPEMTKLYEESDFKTYKKSDFAQFDQVTEYEEFGSCEVIDVKDGMLTICFRDDVSPTGQINKFYKFPPSVADKTIFLDPDEEEFFGQPEYPSTKVGPGFVCDQLWLKKGVGDLLGLI